MVSGFASRECAVGLGQGAAVQGLCFDTLMYILRRARPSQDAKPSSAKAEKNKSK